MTPESLLCVDYELGHEDGAALDLSIGPARFTTLAVPTWQTASPRPPRRDARYERTEANGQQVLLRPDDASGQLSLL